MSQAKALRSCKLQRSALFMGTIAGLTARYRHAYCLIVSCLQDINILGGQGYPLPGSCISRLMKATEAFSAFVQRATSRRSSTARPGGSRDAVRVTSVGNPSSSCPAASVHVHSCGMYCVCSGSLSRSNSPINLHGDPRAKNSDVHHKSMWQSTFSWTHHSFPADMMRGRVSHPTLSWQQK